MFLFLYILTKPCCFSTPCHHLKTRSLEQHLAVEKGSRTHIPRTGEELGSLQVLESSSWVNQWSCLFKDLLQHPIKCFVDKFCLFSFNLITDNIAPFKGSKTLSTFILKKDLKLIHFGNQPLEIFHQGLPH